MVCTTHLISTFLTIFIILQQNFGSGHPVQENAASRQSLLREKRNSENQVFIDIDEGNNKNTGSKGVGNYFPTNVDMVEPTSSEDLVKQTTGSPKPPNDGNSDNENTVEKVPPSDNLPLNPDSEQRKSESTSEKTLKSSDKEQNTNSDEVDDNVKMTEKKASPNTEVRAGEGIDEAFVDGTKDEINTKVNEALAVVIVEGNSKEAGNLDGKETKTTLPSPDNGSDKDEGENLSGEEISGPRNEEISNLKTTTSSPPSESAVPPIDDSSSSLNSGSNEAGSSDGVVQKVVDNVEKTTPNSSNPGGESENVDKVYLDLRKT